MRSKQMRTTFFQNYSIATLNAMFQKRCNILQELYRVMDIVMIIATQITLQNRRLQYHYCN
jgi:hypothetical protein